MIVSNTIIKVVTKIAIFNETKKNNNSEQNKITHPLILAKIDNKKLAIVFLICLKLLHTSLGNLRLHNRPIKAIKNIYICDIITKKKLVVKLYLLTMIKIISIMIVRVPLII